MMKILFSIIVFSFVVVILLVAGSGTKQPSTSSKYNGVKTAPEYYSFELYYDSSKGYNIYREILVEESKKNIIEETAKKIQISPLIFNDLTFIFTDISETVQEPLYFRKNNRLIEIKPLDKELDGLAYPAYNLIVIDSSATEQQVKELFLHELGHIIHAKFSTDEVNEYMQLRNMSRQTVDRWSNYYSLNSKDATTLILTTLYIENPNEDFADVFKVVLATEHMSEDLRIKTIYGNVTVEQMNWFRKVVSPKLQ